MASSSGGVSINKVPLGNLLRENAPSAGGGRGSPDGMSSSVLAREEHGVKKGHGPWVRWKASVFNSKFRKSGSTCPTCKGSGYIPKGQEDELVALIPYKDKRLKPRRTLFYVALVTLLLLAAGGVLTGFFYPRSLGVTIVNLNSTNDTNLDIYWDLPLDNESYVAILEILTMVKIKNSNFLPVTISALNVTLENYSLELGLMMHPSLIVASRSSKTVTVLQNATYVQPQANKIIYICTKDHQYQSVVYIKASVSAKYTYLGQGSTALDDQSHFVPCSTVIAVPTAMQGQVT